MQRQSVRLVNWILRSLFALIFVILGVLMTRDLLQRGTEATALWTVLPFLFAPLALIFYAAELLLVVAQQEQYAGSLTRGVRRLLYWSPRILGLLFVGFVGMFALDVFSEGYGFWETALALLIHLLPALALLLAVVLGWRWEWIGALTFLGCVLLFLVTFGGGWGDEWVMYTIFLGPPLMLGLLFLANWWLRKELRTAAPAQPAR